ncbi:MAG: prephenate dehydratase domain-containing protein, partial [Mycobacterium sp.]
MIDAGMIPQHSPDAVRPVPAESTTAALDSVRDGVADYACVAIENSIDGPVVPTLDTLAIGTPLQV